LLKALVLLKVSATTYHAADMNHIPAREWVLTFLKLQK